LVPVWDVAYANGNVGGLLEAMLRPTGNFGKFLTVLLSLSVTGNIAATFYSMSLNIQVFVPWLVIIPRYVFSLLATAVYVLLRICSMNDAAHDITVSSVVPLAIVGSHKFYNTLSDFLGLIGYWASAFGAIILVEHFLFRKNDFTAYDLQNWNQPRKLSPGIAALAAGIASVGIIIPCIDQVWFVGPIAKTTGDIGFEVAFFMSGILYVPFRCLEIRLRKAL
jgi:purine-cytosine permease-like protein